MFRIDKELIESDETGDLFIRYTPALSGNGYCTFSGELRFASFDARVGDGQDQHDAVVQMATDNAVMILRRIASEARLSTE